MILVCLRSGLFACCLWIREGGAEDIASDLLTNLGTNLGLHTSFIGWGKAGWYSRMVLAVCMYICIDRLMNSGSISCTERYVCKKENSWINPCVLRMTSVSIML